MQDFGIAGFRLGVIRSVNEHVRKCLRVISVYQVSSSIGQQAAATLINDIGK